jgi:hypothetical protein
VLHEVAQHPVSRLFEVEAKSQTLRALEIVRKSGYGPAHVEHVRRWLNLLIRGVVDLWIQIELDVGGIDTFVHAELMQIASIRRIQNATAN